MAIINQNPNPAFGSLEYLQKRGQSLQDRLDALDQFNANVSPMVRAKLSEISKNTVGGQMPTEFWSKDLASTERTRVQREAMQGSIDSYLNAILNEKKSARSQKLEEAKAGVYFDEQTGEYIKQGDGFDADTVKKLYEIRSSMETAGLDTSSIDQRLESMGATATNKLTDEDKKILEVVYKLYGRDTKPITGGVQIRGAIAGIHPFDPETRETIKLYDVLKAKLELLARKQLKGTGTISDFEMKLLKAGATTLDRNLSDDAFRAVLEQIQLEMANKLPSAQGEQTTLTTPTNGYIIEPL